MQQHLCIYRENYDMQLSYIKRSSNQLVLSQFLRSRMLSFLTGILGSRPSRKLLIVPNSPSCPIGKESFNTLVFFNKSKCACETSILARIASLSSCEQKNDAQTEKSLRKDRRRRRFLPPAFLNFVPRKEYRVLPYIHAKIR